MSARGHNATDDAGSNEARPPETDSGTDDSAAAGPVRVLIVDDHIVFAESLRLALVANGLHSASLTSFDTETVASTVRSYMPDVVLMDLDLGSANGADLIPAASSTGASVLVVTGVEDSVVLAGCLDAGAHGILDKTQPLARLVECIRSAAAGQPVMPPFMKDELFAKRRLARSAEAERKRLFEGLTAREAEVLAALAVGKKPAEIAREWCVAVATVRVHVHSILRKLAVNSQLEAVALVYAHNWKGPTPG